METTSWAAFSAAEPALSARVERRFAAHLHHVLGTVAADGRPRLSGLEVPIRAGQLWLGMMPQSVKAADLRRDPRFAVHSCTADSDMLEGDAKVDGRAVPVEDPAPFLEGSDIDVAALPGGLGLFRADLRRVTLTWVADEALHVHTWTPAEGLVARTIT